MEMQLVVQYLLCVLPGPVDVVTPGDYNWKLQRKSRVTYHLTTPPSKRAAESNRNDRFYLVFVPVRSDQELCGSFCGGVRVRRPHRTALVKHLRTPKQPIDVTSRRQSWRRTLTPNPPHLLQAGAVHLVGADVDKAS